MRWTQGIVSVLLEVANLEVRFDTPDGVVRAVNGLDFELASGETLGIVGESGSGKSQSVLALAGLLAVNGSASGSVRFDGQEILNLPAPEINRLRGRRIAMVFQDPMTSLNPYLTVGTQMSEVLRLHQKMSRRAVRERCVEMLEAVHIGEPLARLGRYPHELSGGMRQRVMIAMALLCKPDLLIADEPTTALDVTVQAQILALLRELQKRFGAAILLITHDLGVVAGNCDRVLVMYGGQVMEQAATDTLFHSPRHPYTRGLLASVPDPDAEQSGPLPSIPGSPPDLLNLPSGCPFEPRCRSRLAVCAVERPRLHRSGSGQASACHLESAT